MSAAEPVVPVDDRPRCAWATSAPDYVAYHDDEWGSVLHGDTELFERLSLEAFQSGLSWLVILRKRPAFRAAFAGFDIDAVAQFDGSDVERLLADAGIVRNRAKITATIANARAARESVPEGLDALLWSFAPQGPRANPRTPADVPATSEESRALAKELKRRGFRFVGPTTAYALMQASDQKGHMNESWDPASWAPRATSTESVAMSKELKRRGFRFVGPTTAHSLMQAVGMFNEHEPECWRADPRWQRPGEAGPA